MKAIFKHTDGEYLEATLLVEGVELRVMDSFGGAGCTPGQEIDVDISVGIDYEGEEWESMFAGNPTNKKALQNNGGWSYRAFGVITIIEPEVMVDVGVMELEAPINTNDSRVLGASVAFTIDRLDANAS